MSLSLVHNNLICGCFYVRNYFVKQLKLHLNYNGPNEGMDWISQLPEDVHLSKEELCTMTIQLEAERSRRLSLPAMSVERRLIISQRYQPLHPHLYKLQESFLTALFCSIVEQCKAGVMPCLEVVPGVEKVFRLPVFTPKFCQQFVEEIVHFEQSDLPKGRPNSMNNYGVLLEELGFDADLLTPLREHYLTPLARWVYPEWCGRQLDSHKAFVVTYRHGNDTHLDFHYDNAEVTLNVALNGGYDDGELYFGRMRTDDRCNSDTVSPCPHREFYGVLHRGQHMHGAMPLTGDATRYNLIVWMRSAEIRNRCCPMCDCKPTLVAVQGPGDGFTQESVQVCTVT